MWFTYMVRCSKNNSLYTGSTSDVVRRVRQHNDGSGAKYTRSFGPVELVTRRHNLIEVLLVNENRRLSL